MTILELYDIIVGYENEEDFNQDTVEHIRKLSRWVLIGQDYKHFVLIGQHYKHCVLIGQDYKHCFLIG